MTFLVRLSATIALASSVACSAHATGLVLTEQAEARRLGTDLQVRFTLAADAANRAVMADTDDTSRLAAESAMTSRRQLEDDIKTLAPILRRLEYSADLRTLDGFSVQYEEYKKLDDETLNLAVENTNLKAQRLSFTSAQQAVDDLRTNLESLSRRVRPRDRISVQALAEEAIAAALAIQVVQARHIAESDDAAMTRMEGQMAGFDADARRALIALQPLVPPAGSSVLANANAALNRLKSVNDEIVQLSRRNTNVRSLALALGQKHALRAKCEAALQALTDTLAQHDFKATR